MPRLRVLLAPIIFALAVMPAQTVTATPVDTGLVDYIFELEPGEDAESWAERIFDELDIPEDRLIYTYEAAINGLWMRLTPDEIDDAEDLKPEGIFNGQAAFEVSVPRPMEMEGGHAYDGPQITSTGYARVEATSGDYSDVDIAILDTGVDAFNDDLNVVGGFDCTFEGHPDEWGIDGYGHGSHVGGIAAALDNDRFVVGPAAGARIHSFKVLGADGSGSMASVLCGVDQVAKQATTIEVANLSLGGENLPSDCYSLDSLHNGFCNTAAMGVTFVVSAGNSATDAIHSSPANYGESVVTVSSLADFDGLPGGLHEQPGPCAVNSPDDTLATYSNYGSLIDFIAPGTCIYSTLPGNTAASFSGTSMAAPLTTGVLAAWISQCGRDHAVEAVTAWSLDVWAADETWTGDHGPDHEPLIRFGAPCPTPEQLEQWEEAT